MAHCIVEDRQGRVWFDFYDRLVRFDGSNWKIYPLPKGQRTNPYQARSLVLLADGRVVLHAAEGIAFLVFNPGSESFASFPSPDRGSIWAMSAAVEGGVWMETVDSARRHRLNLFDGAGFRFITDWEEKQWPLGAMKFIQESKRFGLLAGGTMGLGA
jgi:streptogramin lyase